LRREERQPSLESSQELVRVEQRDSRRRELDCEGKPVEPAADLGHGGRGLEVRHDGLGPLCEQRRGVVVREGLYRVAVLGIEL